ncbi:MULTISPECIES: NTP transferase domain-containing protein [Pseudomonas]|nr:MULTISPECIES: phosphocholine cytidylyltransferase family protein [Pseudomonas]AHZ78133.1 CTP:Inositol-1-phosphate cytidylyltransferase [Pseudomonas putida]AHZ78289.1 CTP:Inositol-1-phosphate cytidylyltransferase [Pseudomonas putida]PNG82011.1 Bifunctional IPC transferase and DIPP synthase [Pseudomonas putida]URD45532.1 phosphocholine cytidylyltransferase family protein [Pseudomonas sp. BYT-5]
MTQSNGLHRVIILSAGQGRRLLPYTESSPKCLIELGGKTVIEWQIDALRARGFDDINVVAGYGIDQVEHLLEQRYGQGSISIHYNPFFEVADNLASCWMARHLMDGEFLLLNGDTVFDLPVLDRLLKAPARPITLAIDHKPGYDSDDMKVCLDGDRLARVGKNLPLDSVDGESIGMMRFQPEGALLFRCALEASMRTPEALQRWYLSIIDHLAQTTGQVFVHSIAGLSWGELDFPHDLEAATLKVRSWSRPATGVYDKPFQP